MRLVSGCNDEIEEEIYLSTHFQHMQCVTSVKNYPDEDELVILKLFKMKFSFVNYLIRTNIMASELSLNIFISTYPGTGYLEQNFLQNKM